MKKIFRQILLANRGATVIFVALAMIVLLGMAALAIDVGYLYVVRGELQNAADAGALAGAQELYLPDGTVNPNADTMADDYVSRNDSEQATVTVESVQRGHWSFGLGDLERGFYPNDSLEPASLWDQSTIDLDENLDFINAVQVITIRTTVDGQVRQPFFARIVGAGAATVRASAVAYIGFAGTLMPLDVDQPIAVCDNAIRDAQDRYTCGVGRMAAGGETAAWTDLIQPEDNVCSGGTNASTVRPLIGTPPLCHVGNEYPIVLGNLLNLINGQLQTGFSTFWDCWWSHSNQGTRPWQMTLPVVECNPDGTVHPCEDVVGAVTVNVIWVNENASLSPAWKMDAPPTDTPSTRPGGAPLVMAGFGVPGETGYYEPWDASVDSPTMAGIDRWRDFVDHFNLQVSTVDDGWTQKTIFFVPDCSPHEPKGTTGGENFGILAKNPVLVR